METEQKIAVSEKSACYIRLSADDSKNPSLSPMNQQKICMAYAKNRGDKISLIYKDINRSGANLQRKGFQTLLVDASNKAFRRLYIKDWSRLTRDIADLRKIRKKIEEEFGISIISTDGVSDDKAIDINVLSGDWYVKEARNKQQQVHNLKLKESVPLNRPPFGYRMNKKQKMFVPDDDKALVVKEIFMMRSEGKTTIDIGREVHLNHVTVYNIIKNKTYLGFNGYKKEWFKGKHEPLIDETTFNQCQSKKTRTGEWVNQPPIKSILK